MKYWVTVNTDKEGMYVAQCPSIPGCMATGKTREQAIDNVKLAIKKYQKIKDLKH